MPFNKQHGKRDQTLLKSEPHHLYQIFCSLWRQLSWRKSLLVICEVLRMFVNILTADDEYSLLNTDNLNAIISDTKNIFLICFCILEIYLKTWTFSKKTWPSYLMCFRNYGFQKTWLNKSLKRPFSENPSTSNMVSSQETFEIWTAPPLPHLLITLQDIELKKISVSNMPNLRNVCYHIDCRWQVFSS